MRILIFNWKDPGHPAAGGAEIYTWEVASRWVRWGHQVTLFAASVPGLPATQSIDGLRVVRDGSRWTVYRAARRFYNRNRGRFDLVIDEVNTRPFLCPRFVHEAPVVALIHQVADDVWRYELPLPIALVGRYFFEPRWLRTYRDVPALTPSQSSRRSLHRYGLRHVSVVPIGVSLPEPPPSSLDKEADPTVAFLGRLTAAKQPDHAIEAVRLVREQIPNARLWVIGTGPLEAQLRAQAPSWVEFHGWVDQERKFELLGKAHALVVTSVREGWGLVVDEAAVVGTTTLAYDVPGLRDSVPAARGILTSAHPTALATQLIDTLPALASRPPTGGWRGGAVGWDEVARRVLDEALRLTGKPASSPTPASYRDPHSTPAPI